MKNKQPSQDLKDWFTRQGINCPESSAEAMAIFNEHKFNRFTPKSEGEWVCVKCQKI